MISILRWAGFIYQAGAVLLSPKLLPLWLSLWGTYADVRNAYSDTGHLTPADLDRIYLSDVYPALVKAGIAEQRAAAELSHPDAPSR
jgi:hypothetical protein